MSKRNVVLNICFLSVIFLVAYYFLIFNMAVVELNVKTDHSTTFRIYYKTTDSHWSQRRSAVLRIKPGRLHYKFRLGNLRHIDELRIDTSEKPAVVTVHSMTFIQSGYEPLLINSEKQFEQLQVANGIAKFSYTNEGFTVVPATSDPFLIYATPPLEKNFNWIEELARLAFIVLLATVVAMSSPVIVTRYRFALGCSLVVLTLVSVMAGVSKYNVHPDELAHVRAAEYFTDHYLPPPVGDSETLDTYSVYGSSRLHIGEIAYLFAGKFAQLLAPLRLDSYIAMRFFNVTLFGVLCLLALKFIHFRIILLPVLLSPQIWYIFSYFNSEGYSLFITLLVSYQMVSEKSSWNRLLTMEKVKSSLFAIIGLGILLSLLLLAKKNFYFYGLFLVLYFIWRLWFKKTVLTKSNLLRIASVVIVGLTIFSAVRLTDNYINDFEKDKKKYEAEEAYASEQYKPSTPLDKKFGYLFLKDRGITAMEALRGYQWGEKSFRTAFGGYGYTSVSASPRYYDAVRYTALLLLFIVAVLGATRGGWEGRTLLAITFVTAVGLISMAFYHSWTRDFQAQGRYFLPIVGMLSIFVFHLRHSLSNLACTLLFFTLFGISVYSFIFVGLAGISKIREVLC